MGIYTVPAGISLHMCESIHNLWPLCLGPMGVAIEDLALIQSYSDTRIARGVITADLIGLENILLIAFNMVKTGDGAAKPKCWYNWTLKPNKL